MTKKNTAVETVSNPIWPMDFAAAPQDGGSPLPVILVVGDVGRGKSSFIQSIAPTLPGQPPRTLVLDTEQSHSTLRHQFGAKVIDLRARAAELQGDNLSLKMFEAFLDAVAVIEQENQQWDVIGVETLADLHFGAYFYVDLHQELYKPSNGYKGEIGNNMQWADASKLMKELAMRLSRHCQSVVFGTHVKDERDKKTKAITGRKAMRGPDFTDGCSLIVWLFDERDADPNGKMPGQSGFAGQRWAHVRKQRLDYITRDEDGEFIQRPLLPQKLLPRKQGQTFPALIRWYMANPQLDYGDLDKVEIDPTIEATTEHDRAEQQAEAERQAAATRLYNAKVEMIRRLVADGVYPDMNAVGRAVTSSEELAALATDINQLEVLEARLRALVGVQDGQGSA